jgi:hypothetical protein
MKHTITALSIGCAIIATLFVLVLGSHRRPVMSITIENRSNERIAVWFDSSRPFRWIPANTTVTPDRKFWDLEGQTVRIESASGRHMGDATVRLVEGRWRIIFPEDVTSK